MSRRYVQQLTDGEALDEVYLVADKQLRANRNGNLYLQLDLRDRTGGISARLWNAGRHLFRSFEEGDFLRARGKVRELSYQRVFSYTDEGQLLGHLVLGVEMLSEKAAEVGKLLGEPFPPELLLRLKHMIVSHHGTYEFGSPRLPMTPEAIALHHLDNFDAKVHSFTRDIREDGNNASAWTPFNQSVQRRLFKGGRGAAPAPGEE